MIELSDVEFFGEEPKEAIYNWTGIHKTPKEGEWFFHPMLGPIRACEDYDNDVKYFILRREDVPDRTEGGP